MPSFGPSTQDAGNRGASTQRLINCYRQPVMGKSRSAGVLNSVLGTEDFADFNQVFHYGSFEHQNSLYSSMGGRLFRTSAAGVVTDIGSISSGQADLSGNQDAVVVVAAQNYFVVSGGSITNYTPAPFANVGSLSFMDQYTLYTEANGRRFAWSDLADPTSLPALNFKTAEATDSNIIRGVAINGRYIVFKADSREVNYNTGQSGPDAFERLAGGTRNTGLKAFPLLTFADEALFFIGDDNIARMTSDGLDERKFSYPPVDSAIANGEPTECFYYEDEGQKFCVIRFADRPSWVLDLATGEWHERSEGPRIDPWSLRSCQKVDGQWLGVTDGGKVLSLKRNNRDATVNGADWNEGDWFSGDWAIGGSQPLIRKAVSETFYAEEIATLDELEIYARTGFHNLSREAQMWIRLSRDGGHTWTLEKWRGLGSIGEYRQKATWRHQGAFEQLTIEANIAEPVEIPLWSDFRMEAA